MSDASHRREGIASARQRREGDLYVAVIVRIPEMVTDRERRLWEQLRSTEAAAHEGNR